MKTVCLVNPPSQWLISDKDNPPLGLMIIAGYLRENVDAEIKMCDLAGLDEKDWDIPKADVYGITGTVTQHQTMKYIINLIGKENPDACIVVGGPHASILKEKLLVDIPRIDKIVVGDGEYLMKSIIEGHELMNILEGSNEQDLDKFPFPAWDWMKGYYATVWHNDPTILGATVITSRGCPWNCSFCASPLLSGRRVRYNSIEYIEKQLKWLVDLGYKGFYFVDDILTIDKKRMAKLSKMLKQIGLPWRCYARVDTVTQDLLNIMAEGGCVQVDYGLESGSDTVLRHVEKSSTVDKARQAVQWTLNSGITAKCCFIAGLPYETENTFEETKEFIRDLQKMGDVLFTINTLVPLPGTAIGDSPEAFDYPLDRSIPYSQYMGRDARTTFTTDEVWNRKTLEWYDELISLVTGKSVFEIAKRKKELVEKEQHVTN